ncbi:hypothetical protein M5X06_08550 [Paenibacillus alvei]|uniref:Core-binding (CB) domain-containing protein n=1 Tax=Paenibacillus alvei TaxID=44250 RepID=A0ABT4H5Z4_PAEAL|nr:hypothetical protein [Paenibacillus alvei]MCY9764400.1 hypothetical protein [Paenibacillus alvei]MCY9766882.1 hypothetical protein [Paenibacillus alvei]
MNRNYVSSTYLEKLKDEFIEFLYIRDNTISERTVERYENDLIYFFNNSVSGKVTIDSLNDMFNPIRLKGYFDKRKGSTARATITNLLDFFRHSHKISSDEYINASNELKKYAKKGNDDVDFLNKADIRMIFSDSIKFLEKDKEANIILPVICSLAYYHCFEQIHLQKLKRSDLKIDEGIIRNLRSDDDESNITLKWINLSDESKYYLSEYLKYIDRVGKRKGNLLYIDGQQADNKSINKMLSIFNERSFNKKQFSTKVHIQKLNRSGIFHSLVDTNGNSAINYFHLFGLKKNTQFEYALEKYLFEVNSMMAHMTSVSLVKGR